MFVFTTTTGITLAAKTADAGDDYTDIGTTTNIDFEDGEVVEELLVSLLKDNLVEGIECFEAQLGAITTGDTAKITVDTMLNKATIFIVDTSCMFYFNILCTLSRFSHVKILLYP